MAKIRIDKLISDQSFESRGVIKKEIKKYGVKINEKITKNPGKIIDTEKDLIVFRGKKIEYQEYTYIMLNKPAGLVSAVTDDRDKTVIEHIRNTYPLKESFPVGRLDKDTEGLLIITNDGQFAHQIINPKKNIPKKYYVEIDGIIKDEDLKKIEEGVFLEDGYLTKKAQAILIDRNKEKDTSSLYLIITEGKFHQVKRMIKSVGLEVSYLKRVEIGSLELDPLLEIGDFRELREEELALLKKDGRV